MRTAVCEKNPRTLDDYIADTHQDWPPETTGMYKLDLAQLSSHVQPRQLSRSWVTTRPMSHSSRWYWINAKSMDSLPSMWDKGRSVTSTIGTVRPRRLPSLKFLPLTINLRRIWAAIKRETLLALSEGVCTPREVDAIFKDVLKSPKGPCETMDVVGLDVVLDIENHYADTRSGLPIEPRDYLRKMIQGGRLGVKSGHGFYDYKDTNGEIHS